MYSAVLMLALAGTPQAPDCCWGCGWGCGWGYGWGYAPAYWYPAYYYSPVCYAPVAAYSAPATKAPENNNGTATEQKEEDGAEDQASGQGRRATVIVTLPADARLRVDGKSLASGSGRRVFTTPTLSPVTRPSYLMTAAIERDGKVETRTRKVIVQGGRQTLVHFDFAATDVARR